MPITIDNNSLSKRITYQVESFSLTMKKHLTLFIEKVKNVVSPIFKSFYQIVTFPLRYLGSKKWSVCGLLFRMPYNLVKRQPIIENTGYHRNFQKHLNTSSELMPYYKYITAATTSYDNDSKWLNGLNLSLHCFANSKIDPKSISEGTIKNEYSLMDPGTGLKIIIAQNDEEAIITFGSTGSCACEYQDESKAKPIRYRQTLTTIGNLMGYSPALFEQACKAVEALTHSGCLSGKKISLTGQNLGGTIAAYVGLKKQMNAVCFNAIPFGAGLQYHLGSELLSQADKYVTHICVKNDFASDLRILDVPDHIINILGFRTAGNFGIRFSIPSAFNSVIETHSHIMGSFRKVLGFKIDETKQTESLNLPLEIKAKFNEFGLSNQIILMKLVDVVLESLNKKEAPKNLIHPFNLIHASSIDLVY